jgi:hypothetical protein
MWSKWEEEEKLVERWPWMRSIDVVDGGDLLSGVRMLSQRWFPVSPRSQISATYLPHSRQRGTRGP